MEAAVVYDSAGSGGTLFEGKKFWVAQRVPSRLRWVELITTNGGQIVLLEKLADIVIADHARKDAVPGSYSWTWIEQSVKNGRLEDLNDHRAGPVAGTSRPVGSAQPTRSVRNAFTDADDRALALWVLSAEKQGLSTKGNVIYQQLERINPRHTFQSWRDRWVKHGQFQSHRDMIASPGAPGPVPERPSATTTTKTKTTCTELPSNGSTARPASSSATNTLNLPKIVQASSLPTDIPSPQKSPKPLTPSSNHSESNPFTEEDAELLMGMYDDIMNIDETKLIEAWEKFAEFHPQHTTQEWYKFWMVKIKPSRTLSHRKSRKRKRRVILIQGQRGDSPEKSESSGQRLPTEPIPQRQADRRHESLGHFNKKREYFEHSLGLFAEARNKSIDFQPAVSGRKVQLYDLWNIFKKLEFHSFNDGEPDIWDQIASKLDFDKFRDSSAASEIRDLYDWILGDFNEAQSRYLEAILDNGTELTEEQQKFLGHLLPSYEKDEVDEQRVVEEYDNETETLKIPSTPPQQIWPCAELDRGVLTDPENESLEELEVNPDKRQRVDKGKERVLEIPWTPEDRLSFKGPSNELSPVKHQDLSQEQEDEAEDSEEVEGIFVKPMQRRIFPETRIQATQTAHYEPETQDFHFRAVEEENGAPPSQQTQEDVSLVGESVAAVAGSLHEDFSTQSQTDSQRDVAEIREFVDNYVALGYPEEIVVKAMLATTLETGDVGVVVEAIMQGAGIPENMEGVWTVEDDRAVRLIEENEEYARLVLKHGEARCMKRRQFLSDEALKNS